MAVRFNFKYARVKRGFLRVGVVYREEKYCTSIVSLFYYSTLEYVFWLEDEPVFYRFHSCLYSNAGRSRPQIRSKIFQVFILCKPFNTVPNTISYLC